MASISIPEPDNRLQQLVRNDLLSSFGGGNSQAASYVLKLTSEAGARRDVHIPRPYTARSYYSLAVAYVLMDGASEKVMTSGNTYSQVSYDVIGQPIADNQARDDARDRAVHEVGADIRTRLAAYFSSR